MTMTGATDAVKKTALDKPYRWQVYSGVAVGWFVVFEVLNRSTPYFLRSGIGARILWTVMFFVAVSFLSDLWIRFVRPNFWGVPAAVAIYALFWVVFVSFILRLGNTAE